MRILLIRTSALGDIVHSLPVLTALRRRMPAARIGWVVEEGLAPLLAGHPDLDVILPVALRRWRHRPLAPSTMRAVRSSIAGLRAFRADLAIDLMGNHKAGILARLSGAPVRLGARRVDRREPSSVLWINRSVALSGDHAAARSLSILAGLDGSDEPPDFGPREILAATPSEIGDWLARRNGTRFAFIHPGAAWINKRYPVAAWAAVVRELHARGSLATVVGAAPGEEGMAEEIRIASGNLAEVVPAPSLGHLAALLRAAAIVLGGDTGPMHLAHALGVPVIMLMGPTDPTRHGPFGAPEAAMVERLPCSFCYRRLDEIKPCMLAHNPRAVVDRALERLRALAPAPLC